MATDLKALLKSVGKKVFVDYFDLFRDERRTPGEVANVLATKYELKASQSRTSTARRIIREGWAREALEIIADSDGVDPAAARKARELLRSV